MPTKSVRAVSNRDHRAKRKTTKHPEPRPERSRRGSGVAAKSRDASSQPLATLRSALDNLKPTFGPYTIAEPDHATAPVVIILPVTIGYCTHCTTLRPYTEMITVHQCQHCK